MYDDVIFKVYLCNTCYIPVLITDYILYAKEECNIVK